MDEFSWDHICLHSVYDFHWNLNACVVNDKLLNKMAISKFQNHYLKLRLTAIKQLMLLGY